MRSDVSKVLQDAARGVLVDRSIWEQIVEYLGISFESFVGAKCHSDESPVIDNENSSFSFWMWSDASDYSPVAVVWSAVMNGSRGGSNGYVVTADLFLFHSQGRRRLRTQDGDYLTFQYAAAVDQWSFQGWVKDEYQEWENLDLSF